MATADDVIRVALAELGNTDGAKYFAHFGEVDLGAWCVAWSKYVEDVAGCPLPWPWWYAWDTHDAGYLGSTYRDKWSLAPGESLGFDWDNDGYGDHVGIVRSVHDWGCCTIEGNTGVGIVAERQRVWANITCGIHPAGLDGKPQPRKIDVDGEAYRATIRFWQEQMGLEPDGVLSDQLWPHDRYRRAVTAIEHYHLDYADYAYGGSSLVRAVQAKVGVPVDGDWGAQTTDGIQLFLRKKGYYDGGIDQDFGYHSVECLQMSLNDGVWA
jgi:peptidoglycan hydrolase-like protein with peptidoglycan-binding domain